MQAAQAKILHYRSFEYQLSQNVQKIIKYTTVYNVSLIVSCNSRNDLFSRLYFFYTQIDLLLPTMVEGVIFYGNLQTFNFKIYINVHYSNDSITWYHLSALKDDLVTPNGMVRIH